MSSVLVEYPEGLPAPTVGEVRPTERRAISNVGQMRNTRAIQRDRHGTRTVAFTFTPEQAAIFREWWVEWLQLGGGWFAANWPLPWSRGPNVFRFTDPPQWQLIGGRLDGQGYWQVRATCEIRGRGMLPTMDVMYLTSTPYPLDVFDSANIEIAAPTGGTLKLQPFALEAAQISPGFRGGELREPIVAYENPIYAFNIATEFSDGTLKTPLHQYDVPPELVAIDPVAWQGGALVMALLTYTNWAPEPIGISDIKFAGGSLT